MKVPALLRRTVRLAGTALLLAALLVTFAGCDQAVPSAPTSGTLAVGSNLVPDVPLDVYTFIRQPGPTQIPHEVLRAASDFSFVSLALWGQASGNVFTWGGALTMSSPDEAAAVIAHVPANAGVWMKQAGAVVYFVKEGASDAAAMKAAITDGRLVNYDFQPGIDALSFYPDGGTTLALAAAVAVPDDPLINLVTRDATADVQALVNTLTKSAGLEVVTAGLYAAALVDIRAIAAAPTLSSILSLDAGVLVSAKSKWPGFIIGILANNAIKGTGYEKGTLGDMEVYRGTLDVGNGVNVPVVIRVSGSRIFAAVSGQQSYAEALIAGLRSP